MKALAGGLVTNADAAFAYIAQYDNVLPIWGIQRPEELEQWLGFFRTPASLTPGAAQLYREGARRADR